MKKIVCALALLSACGGGSATVQQADTSGGEESVAQPPMRTTIPVPVPAPAVAREEMSAALQQLWTQIEETVAIRPPEPPTEPTIESVQAWADGPFSEWVTARRTAMEGVRTTSEGVPEDPPHERAVASALFGYALEDFCADVRGAPIPSEIASDAELLEVYLSALREVTLPIASDAIVSYAYCQRRLAPLGDESEWLPWRAYCVQRGQDIISVYELASEQEAPAEEPIP